jgi:MFS family permease
VRPIDEKTPFSAWWMLAVLFLLYVVSIIDRYIITMLVPSIKTSLDLTDFQIGILLGPAFSFFYALFGLPLGWAADRYPRRWVIFLGALTFGLATASGALAGSFVALLAARMLVGVGEASLSPAAFSLMADRFPRGQLTTASSIYNTAAKVGVATAYAAGGLIIGLAATRTFELPLLGALEPWRLVFVLTGLPAVVLGVLVFTFKEPRRTKPPMSGTAAPVTIFRYFRDEKRLMIPMLVGFCSIGMVSFGLSGWAPTYITREFGWPPERYGPILGVISLAAAGSLVIKGLIVDWLYRRNVQDAHIRLFTWLLMGTLPIAVILFFLKDPLLFLVGYGVVQIVAMPIVIYFSAATQLIAPSYLRGQVIAVFLLSVAIFGSGMGPLVVGALTDYVFQDDQKIGYSLTVLVCTMMPLGLVCLRLALKPMRDAMARADEEYGARPNADEHPS